MPSCDSIQVFPLIPTPFEDIFDKESENTIWKYLVDNNYLITRNYFEWLKPNGLYNCVVSYPHLSNKDIKMLIEKFYREFYFRPSYILYKSKQSLFSLSELQRNVRGFITLLRR